MNRRRFLLPVRATPPVVLNAVGIVLGEQHRKVCDACAPGFGARVFTACEHADPLRESMIAVALAQAVMRPIPKPERRKR